MSLVKNRAHCITVLLICVGIAICGASAVKAEVTCQDGPAGRYCRAEVPFEQFSTQAFQRQYQSQWCWAASIAMVLAYAGHPVSQERIVTEAYGAPVNMPAAAGIVMARQLNRDWADDRGDGFSVRVSGLYDAQGGIAAITNQQIINELAGNRPLVLGARSHAMVLTAIDYEETPFGPRVVAAYVFDPWPGVGARALQPDELVAQGIGGSMRFLAAISVAPM